MILQYEQLWPGHPFYFWIPFSNLQAGVEIVKIKSIFIAAAC
jgi:hypothetical protein